MIQATAKLIDKTEVDKLVVEVTFRATVGELRQISARASELTGNRPIPWPLADLIDTLKKVVVATVDRVEGAQSTGV